MKKLISMAAAVILFVGAVSCSQDKDDPKFEGTGSVTVNLSLGNVTKAVVSTAKPTTTWADVDRMLILFVNTGTSQVEDARVVDLPSVKTDAAQLTQTFTDVKANPDTGWDTYIIANYPSDWNVGNVVGKSIEDQLAIAAAPLTVENDGATTDDDGVSLVAGADVYDEAPEVFVAKKSATEVKIPNGGNLKIDDPFKLARAVSLVRIRVDQDPDEAPDNIDIDLSNAIFAIRRATTTYSMSGSYTYVAKDETTQFENFPGSYAPTTPDAENVFFSKKSVLTENPTTGYEVGSSAIMADGIDLWNDYLIWAGGSDAETAANRFDIVLSGVTKDDTYIPFGATDPVAEGTRVYWTGAVNGIVGPNQILELILTLKTAGSTTKPDVGQYGNLEIFVDLVPWGDIIEVQMNM